MEAHQKVAADAHVALVCSVGRRRAELSVNVIAAVEPSSLRAVNVVPLTARSASSAQIMCIACSAVIGAPSAAYSSAIGVRRIASPGFAECERFEAPAVAGFFEHEFELVGRALIAATSVSTYPLSVASVAFTVPNAAAMTEASAGSLGRLSVFALMAATSVSTYPAIVASVAVHSGERTSDIGCVSRISRQLIRFRLDRRHFGIYISTERCERRIDRGK